MPQETHALAAAPALFPLDPAIRPLFEALAVSTRAKPDLKPFTHWLWRDMLPEATAQALRVLPFQTPDLHGVSGKRELHNDSRHYFDAINNARFTVCGDLARLFQAAETVRLLQDATGADLTNTNVRIEYALDTDSFWLQPHTDLGVKKITILYYLPDGPDQESLGTDLYTADEAWAARSPFAWNSALVFVPGAATFHGFERREIPRVRRSVIINYVTQDWRAREQLAYPDHPVRV